MGMFDDVLFAHRMPDGFSGRDYQTKSLECTMDAYEISPQGRLIRVLSSGYANNLERELCDIDFAGVLNFFDWDAARGAHEYDLTFEAEVLQTIRC